MTYCSQSKLLAHEWMQISCTSLSSCRIARLGCRSMISLNAWQRWMNKSLLSSPKRYRAPIFPSAHPISLSQNPEMPDAFLLVIPHILQLSSKATMSLRTMASVSALVPQGQSVLQGKFHLLSRNKNNAIEELFVLNCLD